jgi:flagellin
MSMVVNTNVLALVTQSNMKANQTKLNNAVEQLSSGLRINSAMDDPAGLAIGTSMQAQVNGMNQGITNANAAISMAQVADGAMGSVTNMLQQMRTLAVEAANGTNTGSGDADLQSEFTQLATQINNTLGNTQFNGISVFSMAAGGITYQVGANVADTVVVASNTLATDTNVTQLATSSSVSIASVASASAAITAIDTALSDVNTTRASNGAYEIQFQQIVSSQSINSQNTAAAVSSIMDTDYAQATSALTQAQIVQQAGTAMLSQANSVPQQVLSLLSKLP